MFLLLGTQKKKGSNRRKVHLGVVGVQTVLGGESLTMDAGAGKHHHGRVLEGFEAQGLAAVRMRWFVGDVEVEAGQTVWSLCGWGRHRLHL